MNDDRTPRKIAIEMEPLICVMCNASAAMHAARTNTDTVLYILGKIEKDAQHLKRLWRDLWEITHKSYKPPLKAVEE